MNAHVEGPFDVRQINYVLKPAHRSLAVVGPWMASVKADELLRVAVDGTGLTERRGDRLVEHSARKETMSLVPLAQAAGGLVFDLGETAELETLQIWNYNEPGYTVRGIAKTDVSVWTPEGGWKTVLRQATVQPGEGTDAYDEPTLLTFAPTRAQKVRLDNLSPFVDEGFVGLSAIRFYGAATLAACNPRPAAEAAIPCVGQVELVWTPGKKAVAHDVYAAAEGEEMTLLGRIAQSQAHLEGLAGGKAYRWRVDQVSADGSVTVGPEWGFRVAEGRCLAQWVFDESSGSIVHDSIGHYHGTLHGGPVLNGSGYLQFDGVDDYVELPIGPLMSDLVNSTFEMWVDFASREGNWQRIFDFGNSQSAEYLFLSPLSAGNRMRFAMTTTGGGGEQTLDAEPLPEGLRHVAVTINHDAQTVTLYVDGKAVETRTSITHKPADMGVTTRNWLGRSQYAADGYFKGALHRFSIYNRCLSGAEIAALFDGVSVDAALADGGAPKLALAGAELLDVKADLKAVAAAQAHAGEDADAVSGRNLLPVLVIIAVIVALAFVVRWTKQS